MSERDLEPSKPVTQIETKEPPGPNETSLQTMAQGPSKEVLKVAHEAVQGRQVAHLPVLLPPGVEAPTGQIDKSALAFPEPKRIRDREHLRFVARQPCLVCGRTPSQAHHLRIAQPRALGRKVSDEFTVPLCAVHHHDLHLRGNEAQWWKDRSIEPLQIADELWSRRRHGEVPNLDPDTSPPNGETSIA